MLRGNSGLSRVVKLFVPSTVDDNQDVDLARQEQEAMDVAKWFSRWFGGATIQQATGAWESKTGDVITEHILIVSANCTASDLEEHENDVERLAARLRVSMQQEAVAVEIDGTLYFA